MNIVFVSLPTCQLPTANRISKNYHLFRQLSKRLRDAADLATAGIVSSRDLSKSATYVVRLADAFSKLIDSEPVEYVAKVSFRYVKRLAKERSGRLDDALETIIQNFPPSEFRNEKGVSQLVREVEVFFLSDHVVEEGKEIPDYLKNAHESQPEDQVPALSNEKSGGPSSPAQPKSALRTEAISRKTRRSVVLRAQDTDELKQLENERGGLVLLEDDANTDKLKSKPKSSKIASSLITLGIPSIKVAAFALAIYLLHAARDISIKVDGDYALLFCFVLFAMGFKVSRLTEQEHDEEHKAKGKQDVSPRGVKFTDSVEVRAAAKQRQSLALLRKSMSLGAVNRKALMNDISEDDIPSLHEEAEFAARPLVESPLATFPPNGDPETDFNCISGPPCDVFPVRGKSYLVDRKKSPSEAMLFPCRGADLLLTDECPENVGRYEQSIVYTTALQI